MDVHTRRLTTPALKQIGKPDLDGIDIHAAQPAICRRTFEMTVVLANLVAATPIKSGETASHCAKPSSIVSRHHRYSITPIETASSG
jgi:hypothetical protein